MTLNDWKILSNELERMWEKEVLAYFRALYQNFPGEIEENHE
jgi:hypothetical protein